MTTEQLNEMYGPSYLGAVITDATAVAGFESTAAQYVVEFPVGSEAQLHQILGFAEMVMKKDDEIRPS